MCIMLFICYEYYISQQFRAMFEGFEKYPSKSGWLILIACQLVWGYFMLKDLYSLYIYISIFCVVAYKDFLHSYMISSILI